ncbi:centrosomal protein of 72 kDa isoform X2 [Rhineura floridana]|uniref:centrosomal protein of 72 kDa isoform X2 n=1 Tax=Rhineura floridana TaxID=261503 RepID=UPI002AC892F6|nr:centrosomal protein of 72 kDa isoform X2 [Rhineura floridana]
MQLCLADVRSLSLPGTYHEKISHLGNSLKNFIRLKSLDLSRNVLTTLEGLQHLTYLEKLNLYFNCISSLSEVFRLHSLTALKDVDLRLNPVVKNESDYRLFVVHMLPNLRRLDDRPVRDSERKASLLHFSTDHAYKFKKPAVVTKGTEAESSAHPRVEYINSMSKKCLMMDEDDEAVLNLITKCEWDLSKSPGITGSTRRGPEVEFHDLNSIYKTEHKTKMHWKSEVSPPQLVLLQKWKQENLPKAAQLENRNMLKATETYKEYRNLPTSPALPVAYRALGQRHEKRKTGVKVALLGPTSQELSKREPNLKVQNEAEKYEKITTHATFTPHPDKAPPGVNELLVTSQKTTMEHDRKGPEPKGVTSHGDIPQGPAQPCETAPMERLLDLVDKYWNGCRSLHCNETFLSQAETVLSAIQNPVPTDQQKPSPTEHQELNNLLLEKAALKKHLSEQQEQYSAKISSLTSDLNNTKKDMDILKQRLDKLLEENAALIVHNSKVEQKIQGADTADVVPLQITKLENHNQLLTDENASLKQRLQHFDKMQQLTEMLQESHRTLVSTNERLLKEVDEARSRHKAEVEQLHWNYDQLKKTTDALPPSNINRC